MTREDYIKAIALLEEVAGTMHTGLDMTKADHHILAVRLIELADKLRELIEGPR